MKRQTKKMIFTFTLMLGLLTNKISTAQEITSSNDQMNNVKYKMYQVKPLWKDMLEDTTVNYFEVQKAFSLFWEGKELPAEENEIIGENKGKLKNNFINRVFNSKELKEQQERAALSFDCKKYRRWLIINEPYVQDDGSIMTPHQRLELWRKHYEELGEQTKK